MNFPTSLFFMLCIIIVMLLFFPWRSACNIPDVHREKSRVWQAKSQDACQNRTWLSPALHKHLGRFFSLAHFIPLSFYAVEGKRRGEPEKRKMPRWTVGFFWMIYYNANEMNEKKKLRAVVPSRILLFKNIYGLAPTLPTCLLALFPRKNWRSQTTRTRRSAVCTLLSYLTPTEEYASSQLTLGR